MQIQYGVTSPKHLCILKVKALFLLQKFYITTSRRIKEVCSCTEECGEEERRGVFGTSSPSPWKS
jgi:hypothetical protein